MNEHGVIGRREALAVAALVAGERREVVHTARTEPDTARRCAAIMDARRDEIAAAVAALIAEDRALAAALDALGTRAVAPSVRIAPRQADALRALARMDGPCGLTGVARAMGVRVSSAQYTLAVMESAGHVEARGAKGFRAWLLTPAGRALAAGLNPPKERT